MKKSDEAYEKNLVCNVINIVITIIKWLFLSVCVINAGLTIGLLVMVLVKGNSLPNTLLATMVNFMTSYSETEILALIQQLGSVKVIVAGVGYGFITSLTYGLLYNLVARFKILFASVVDGNMFTKENVKLINDALPLTLIVAFAQPVVMYCIIYATKVFGYEDINVSGITYIFVAYFLKLIFERGFEVEKKSIKYDKELSDYKAREGENKISALKKEIEAKETKKTTKKTTKKEEKETTTKKAKKTATK